MARTEDNLWEIVGITSYGKGCGRLHEFGVYTRVSMYSNWLNTTLRKLHQYTSRSIQSSENVFLHSTAKSSNNFFNVFHLVLIETFFLCDL